MIVFEEPLSLIVPLNVVEPLGGFTVNVTIVLALLMIEPPLPTVVRSDSEATVSFVPARSNVAPEATVRGVAEGRTVSPSEV